MAKKTKLPRISRSVLNEKMNSLPAPVLEHCRRTKKLAAFILERIAAEEWFIETGYNAQSLASAVFYHDIGKLDLALDDLYLTGRTNAEKRARYFAHTEAGIRIVEQELEASLDAYSEKSFAGVLARVIREHHRPLNETGSTDENFERSFTLPGRLTAVADAFDNLLFVGRGGNGDLDQAVAELKQREGKDLDPVLTEALTADMDALEAFVGTLTDNWTYKRKHDPYGLGFTFRKVETEEDAACFLAEPYLNDIYYGRIKTAAFISAAEDGDQIFALETLCIEHLASQGRRLSRNGSQLPEIIYRISPKELEHPTFVRRTASLLQRYGIPADRLVIGLKDSDIAGFSLDAEAFSRELHSEGMGFAITELGEGNSVMTRLGDIGPDMVIPAENLTEVMEKALKEELKNSCIRMGRVLQEVMTDEVA